MRPAPPAPALGLLAEAPGGSTCQACWMEEGYPWPQATLPAPPGDPSFSRHTCSAVATLVSGSLLPEEAHLREVLSLCPLSQFEGKEMKSFPLEIKYSLLCWLAPRHHKEGKCSPGRWLHTASGQAGRAAIWLPFC